MIEYKEDRYNKLQSDFFLHISNESLSGVHEVMVAGEWIGNARVIECREIDPERINSLISYMVFAFDPKTAIRIIEREYILGKIYLSIMNYID
jgi:hypothetical protein